MSAKGCSPDNAAAEGFFGRMKTESVYPEHWEKRTRDEVLVLIDEYIHWYNHERIKQSLGWMSPVQYRQSKEWLHDYLQENVRSPIPQEELTAFRTWCAAHDMTLSQVLTWLIHTFNARQQKMDEAETEKLCRSLEQAAHVKAQAFKEQGRRMVEASEPSLSDVLPMAVMESSPSSGLMKR